MFVVLTLLHGYIGVRLLAPFGAVIQVLGAGLLAMCLWLLPNSFRTRGDRGAWSVLLPLLAIGFFSWLLVLTLVREVSLVISTLVLAPQGQGAWIRSSTIKRNFVEAIVDRVNRLSADMVAITGDVVDGSVRELAHDTEPLGRLESRHGTYIVTGNHEYYSGAHAWIHELRRLGTRVLLNE